MPGSDYQLKAIVGFSCDHYVVFVHCQQQGWLKFDDNIGRVRGSWEHVLQDCTAGLVQPTMLMYDLVDISTAAAMTSASTAAAAAGGRASSSAGSSEVSLQAAAGGSGGEGKAKQSRPSKRKRDAAKAAAAAAAEASLAGQS